LGAKLSFGPPGGGVSQIQKKQEEINPFQRRMILPTNSEQNISNNNLHLTQNNEIDNENKDEQEISEIIADRPVVKNKKKAKKKIIKLEDAPIVSTKIPLKQEIKNEEISEIEKPQEKSELIDIDNFNKYNNIIHDNKTDENLTEITNESNTLNLSLSKINKIKFNIIKLFVKLLSLIFLYFALSYF
jgi:hypothetical protein